MFHKLFLHMIPLLSRNTAPYRYDPTGDRQTCPESSRKDMFHKSITCFTDTLLYLVQVHRRRQLSGIYIDRNPVIPLRANTC